jgi:hypothetical protein
MKTGTLFMLLLLLVNAFAGQPVQSRSNFGATLEPEGRIINGAGQDRDAFANYWNTMHAQTKPAIFMTYLNLRNAGNDWTVNLKSDLMKYSGKFVIPQIGLSMTQDGTPSAHYEQDVAAGLYDDKIELFLDGLQSLALPAYVRIGYEFNGVSWNGYQPASYKAAFTRIVNRIRARGLEVAAVWCFEPDGVTNFKDYYPGDAVVDWWSIDLFSVEHFANASALAFLDSAQVHHKPVMIGESTPRYIGVLNGEQSWNQWFEPFFSLIHSRPCVKAFCYINWNWAAYPQWQSWGDARLEQNTVVAGKFSGEMDSLKYLHASDESTFRKTLGLADATPPSAPAGLALAQPGYPVNLTWNKVTDPAGLSHYIVYRNGIFLDYTLTTPYIDSNVAAGDVVTYTVSAMDRAGNESPHSAALKVSLPMTIEKSLNGEFDNGTQNWQLYTYNAGAAATFQIDAASTVSGTNSAKVTITQTTGTNWHLQLAQPLTISPGHKYKLVFKGKASPAKNINLVLQQIASPNRIYLNKQVSLTSTTQTFSDSAVINTSDQVKLEFFLATPGTGQVWIDGVSILESSTGANAVANGTEAKPVDFSLQQNFPNPFNPATTIEFSLAKQEMVSLKVMTTLGEEVVTLIQGRMAPGVHKVIWNASGVANGVYFYVLQTNDFRLVRKAILMK